MVRKLEVEKQRNVDRAVAPVVVENPVAGSSQGEVVSGQESPVTSAPNSAVGSVKDKILEKSFTYPRYPPQNTRLWMEYL